MMTIMRVRKNTVALAGMMACLTWLAGCAELVIPGTLAGAGEYYRYTTTSVVKKTLMGNVKQISAAAQRALRNMNIRSHPAYASGGQTFISAATAELDIRILLEPVTPSTTRVSIDAAKGEVVKDKATAEEIMAQIQAELDRPEDEDGVVSRVFVKNNCRRPIQVAVYYLAGHASPELWKTEGWFNLSPGEQKHLVDTVARFVYFHGKTMSDHQTYWEGEHYHWLQGTRLGFFRVELGAAPVDFTQSFGCD